MTVRSSSSANIIEGTGTSIPGTAPTGFAAGDRLLAWIVQDTTGTTISGPSGEGWAKIAEANTSAPADGQTANLWEKKSASGSETFAFTSNSAKRAIIQIVAQTGRHATNTAIVSTPTISNTLQETPISVALTGLTALAGDDLLWFGSIDQKTATDTWSFGSISGFTNLQNVGNGNWLSSATFAAENVSAGATGTLTSVATRTGTSNGSWSGVVVAIPAASSGPSVTSVTQTSGGTEGSPAVMTVALSGATSGSTNFAATLAGVTATGSGTDFTSDLANATYSNGVTFSAGNMVVPNAVSGWTVTISTTSDTLDEANETATLTVGGTAGTLTITDDDPLPFITGSAVVTVNRGESVVITANLDEASGRVTGGRFTLTDGTKVGGTDYTNVITNGMLSNGVTISAGVLSIPAGVVSFTITIPTAA